jgi:hypothetical protein
MGVSYSFTVDQAAAQQQLSMLSNLIVDEMSTGINNIVQHIKELIDTDYKRSGNLVPSYMNPSPSGKGFTDRTGALRQSIQAWVEEMPGKTIGYVSAGTDYDKYVELLWDGKYSFMLPALEQSRAYILNEVSWAVLRAIQKI